MTLKKWQGRSHWDHKSLYRGSPGQDRGTDFSYKTINTTTHRAQATRQNDIIKYMSKVSRSHTNVLSKDSLKVNCSASLLNYPGHKNFWYVSERSGIISLLPNINSFHTSKHLSISTCCELTQKYKKTNQPIVHVEEFAERCLLTQHSYTICTQTQRHRSLAGTAVVKA